MLTIQLQDTRLENYIRKMGKEKVEEMFLAFLNSTTGIRDAAMPSHRQPGISKSTHDKIKALNPHDNTHPNQLSQLYDTISETMGDRYAHLTDEAIRADRMRDKGYVQ